MNDPGWEQIGPNGAGHPACRNGVSYPNRNGGRPVRSALAGYGPFLVNKGIAIRKIKDGTSKTVAFSELLKIPGQDMRGCLHWGGGAMYLHTEPPNSAYPDLSRYCAVDQSHRTAPCDSSVSGWTGAHKLAARSAHKGGVNAVMIDGSVRFIADEVDSIPHGTDTPRVWQALSTYRGSELVDSSGY